MASRFKVDNLFQRDYSNQIVFSLLIKWILCRTLACVHFCQSQSTARCHCCQSRHRMPTQSTVTVMKILIFFQLLQKITNKSLKTIYATQSSFYRNGDGALSVLTRCLQVITVQKFSQLKLTFLWFLVPLCALAYHYKSLSITLRLQSLRSGLVTSWTLV